MFKMLSSAVNHVINIDETREQDLKPFQGKCIAIHFQGVDTTIYCHFAKAGLVLSNETNAEVDTTLSGTPFSYFGLHPELSKRGLFKGNMSIQGDLHFGQDVQQFFQKIDIDWESHLSEFIGAESAYHLGGFIKCATNFLSDTLDSMQTHVKDYAVEIAQLSPCKKEIDSFILDVDKLKQDVDRLLQK